MAVKDSEKVFELEGQNFGSMVPGKTAKAMRTCLIWQFIRFVSINIKMIIVVSKSH
jgi:hypothetical protein